MRTQQQSPAQPPITWSKLEEQALSNILVNGKENPLLFRFEYDPVERMLLEVFATGVANHHHELKPWEDRLWIAFHIKNIVKSRNYEIVWEAMGKLMKKEIVGITGDWNRGENIIGSRRMRGGDAMLAVQIHRLLIPWFLDIARQPHVRFTLLMRSLNDPVVYDLWSAIVDLPVNMEPTQVEVAGEKVMITASQKRTGWKFISLESLKKILVFGEEADLTKVNIAYVKSRILTPRFKHLSNPQHSDLRGEFELVRSGRKVIGIDMKISHQTATGSGVEDIKFIEYQLWDTLESFEFSRTLIEAIKHNLTQSQLIAWYIRLQDSNRSDSEYAEAMIYGMYPQLRMNQKKNGKTTVPFWDRSVDDEGKLINRNTGEKIEL